jgi:cysteinyl-tRNA synthetase
VLGLKLPRTIYGKASLKGSGALTVRGTVIPGTVNTRVHRLVEERLNCRKEKKWQRADEIRNKLDELGVLLEDTKAGTDVTYKSAPSEEALDRLLKELGITL